MLSETSEKMKDVERILISGVHSAGTQAAMSVTE